MCDQPHGWTAFLCWLANDWDDWGARALLLVLAAVLLSLLVGVLARVLPFFRMDPDDIRRLSRSERTARAHAVDEALTPDEPEDRR